MFGEKGRNDCSRPANGATAERSAAVAASAEAAPETLYPDEYAAIWNQLVPPERTQQQRAVEQEEDEHAAAVRRHEQEKQELRQKQYDQHIQILLQNLNRRYAFADVFPEGTPVAEERLIPNVELFCIEYPGYVKNFDKAMRTLGGEGGVVKALTGVCGHLELRFRPDPFAHPVNGDIQSTGNLLLKVTRRVKKRKRNVSRARPARGNSNNTCGREQVQDEGFGGEADEQPGEFKSEIVGIITKSARFRTLFDYQYLPSVENPYAQLRAAMETGNAHKMKELCTEIAQPGGPTLPADATGRADPFSLPPPAFTRIEISLRYQYKPNPDSIRIFARAPGSSELQEKIVSRGKHQRHIIESVGMLDRNTAIPNGPSPELVTAAANVDKAEVERVRSLFAERAIWSRLALGNRLGDDAKILRKCLPLVAYFCSSGPFRDLWIRFGYEPRKDPSSRFWQRLVARNQIARKAVRAPRRPGGAGPVPLGWAPDGVASRASLEIPEQKMWETHLFDGVNRPVGGTPFYQVCDITDPELLTIAGDTSSGGVRAAFDPRDGWYTHGRINRLRNMLRRKYQDLMEGKLPPQDGSYDEGDDAGDDLKATREVEEEGEEDEGVPKSHLDRRVDMLLRNLRREQNRIGEGNEENEEEDEDVPLAGDLDDFEDVFGSEDEKDDEEDG